MTIISGNTKIKDLNAQFLGGYNPENKSHHYMDGIEGAQGIMFQCPRCAQGKTVVEEEDDEDGVVRRFVMGVHYVICWFRNPIKARPVPNDVSPGPGRWMAWGDDIDNLTLTPSVHLPGKGCQWHGFVRDGIATLS